MAVIQADIKSALLSLYGAAKSGSMSESDFADTMATIITNAILSADVVAGITLTTPDTINGATTGIGSLL